MRHLPFVRGVSALERPDERELASPLSGGCEGPHKTIGAGSAETGDKRDGGKRRRRPVRHRMRRPTAAFSLGRFFRLPLAIDLMKISALSANQR